MIDFLKLKKSNCKNCYKCIRHCPVKSIRFSGNQAHIVGDECILCGRCFVVCPQNAKEIVNDTDKVKVMLSGSDPVVVSLAPSFVANYDGAGINALEKALKKLGFAEVEETAIGATIVKKEYERMIADKSRSVIITSCCHSVNLLIQKYYPGVLPYLADVVTPMQAHCQDIKKRYKGAKTVFIGPCVSKKEEAARYSDAVDCVLTFEDLTNWLKSENIEIEHTEDSDEHSKARTFPVTGGIIKSMDCSKSDYSYMIIDGVENCISALQDIERGNISNCFIEMSACTGSCIGGPVMEKYHFSLVRDYCRVIKYAGDEDFIVDNLPNDQIRESHLHLTTNQLKPSQIEIDAILKKMGKTRPEQELNCGSCGYDTCREKAIAVYNGKADLSMCLPFLKEKAESFSDNIIN
ncbi:MAG: [Fe-Fe] hydrogenase large subunit C-terminal domain-containing protein, partial [Oscillospiraceae bacterium]